MENYEKAELLAQKANVTLEEARQALMDNDWDLLDAMVALERKNRAAAETVHVDGAAAGEAEAPQPVSSKKKDEGHMGFKAGMRELLRMARKLFRMTLDNDFCVTRFGKQVFAVPVLVLIVLLVFCFWIVLPALLIALFFGCRYRFDGRELGKPGVNRAMDKLGDLAEDIKEKLDVDDEA